MRLVFRPRCCSRALAFCPCWIASVVPMMAGQAAMAVKRPNTIVLSSVDVLMTIQVANVL